MRSGAASGMFVLAALFGLVGLWWSYAKAFEHEWDICPRSACYSGWYVVAGLGAAALLTAGVGVRLLRSGRDVRSRASERKA